ncbi:MAG: hypothetical protein AAF580_10095 [Pseudomonadota bacterium]
MTEEVAALSVRLEATAARFERDVKRAERSMSRFASRADRDAQRVERRFGLLNRNIAEVSKRFIALGSITAIGALGRRALDAADQIDKLAISTGISTDRIQSLRFAADQLGVGADTMTAGLERFNRRLGEFANSGGGPARAALETLGLEVQILSARFPTMDDRLDEVIKRFARVPDASRRAALAAQLFGDEVGPKMSRLLAQGVDGLADLEQQARDLGLVMEQDTISRAVEARDKLDQLFAVIETRGVVAFAELAPVIEDVAELMLKLVEFTGLAINSTRELFDEMERAQKFSPEAQAGRNIAGPLDFIRQAIVGAGVRAVEGEPPAPADAATPTVLTPTRAVVTPSTPTRTPRRRSGGSSRAPRRDDSARDFVEALRVQISQREREINVIGLSERASVRLQAEFERERAQRQLTAAAAREGATITEEELMLARQLIDEQFALTVAAYDREEALRAQAEAADEARRREEELAGALSETADRMLQAAQAADPLRAVLLEIARIAIQGIGGQGPLGQVFGSLINGFSGGGLAPQSSPIPPSRRFASGGIVMGPTAFQTNAGPSLMGEAGPEAIMPLSRGPGGKLGVRAQGGQNVNVNVAFHGVTDFDSFERNEAQIHSKLGSTVRRATGRYR